LATSPILGIPYISSSQNQPEITHNEAISLLQTIVAGGAIEVGENTQPGSPSEGDIYVLGENPTGADWAGNGNKVGGFFNSQWVFVPSVDSDGTPIEMGADQEGLRIWSNADNDMVVWSDTGASPGDYLWRFLGLGQNSILGLTKGYWLNVSNDSNTTTCSVGVDNILPMNGDGPNPADSGNIETGKLEFDDTFDGGNGGFIVDQLNAATMHTIRITAVNLDGNTTASLRAVLIDDKTDPATFITINSSELTFNTGVEVSIDMNFYHGGDLEAIQVAVNPGGTRDFQLNGVLIEARENQ
jgi:hypothetical protein